MTVSVTVMPSLVEVRVSALAARAPRSMSATKITVCIRFIPASRSNVFRLSGIDAPASCLSRCQVDRKILEKPDHLLTRKGATSQGHIPRSGSTGLCMAFGPPTSDWFECIGQGRSAWCGKLNSAIEHQEAPPWNLCITSD